MKKLSVIISLSIILSGCCILDLFRSTSQECNFEEAVCTKNLQALQSIIDKSAAVGGMYIVYNITQNKIVEKNYINFDKSIKIGAPHFHRLFSLTAELSAGTVSPDNIDLYSPSWIVISEIDGADTQKRAFKTLGVNRDGYNTVRQLLFGYLNVFANKDNLLTETQLSALKFHVFGGSSYMKNWLEKNDIQVIEDIYPDIQGFDDIYPYFREFGREMVLFVGTFKARAEDYAIFTVLDSPQKEISYYCFKLDPGCTVEPIAKRIIENITTYKP